MDLISRSAPGAEAQIARVHHMEILHSLLALFADGNDTPTANPIIERQKKN